MLKLLGLVEKYQAQAEDRGALDELKQTVFVRATHLRLGAELETAKAHDLSGEPKKAIRSLAKTLAWASDLHVDADFRAKADQALVWLRGLKSRA